MALTRSAPAASQTAGFDARAAVRFWLIAVAGLVFLMVLVGGATRLTESGLSITQWKPVTGVIPPLSGAEWQAEFDRYKQIPQFAALNPDMTIEGFKTIFWWEWGHRLLARDRRRGFYHSRPVVLAARTAQGRARPTGRRRRRLAGARADRRLVDGDVGLERAHRSGAAAPGAAPHDRRGDVRRPDLRRGRTWRAAAPGRDGQPGFRDFRPAVRCGGVLPARPRRPGRGPARRPHLQHLAAHGIELRSGRSVQAELAASDAQRPGDGAVRSSRARLCDRRVCARSGFRRASRRARRRRSRAARSSSRRWRCFRSGSAWRRSSPFVPIGLALAHQALAFALFGLAVIHLRATEMEQGPRVIHLWRELISLQAAPKSSKAGPNRSRPQPNFPKEKALISLDSLVGNERFQRVIATPGAEQVLPGQERLCPNRSFHVRAQVISFLPIEP